MTRRLILIRHAKSGWDDPMADDHERVLTKRGRHAAAAIGNWLQSHGYVPNRILSSDAARTIETTRLIVDKLQTKPQVSFVPALYHASPDTVLDLVKDLQGTTAVIGHNPGIGMVAQGLVAARPPHHRFSDYPTCAATVIDFDGAVAIGQGTCTDFIVPRDLTD